VVGAASSGLPKHGAAASDSSESTQADT
jgi:hypothetical protein